MQKVEGSNPFSRFAEIPLPSGISSFWYWETPIARGG
jgi:hypothetical protein